ncbi:hypothetical protein Tco_0242059 [Tanacetum coccineum]
MIDLNPTLHDLQEVKTKCALKIDDEKFKKAKSEATRKIRKLAKEEYEIPESREFSRHHLEDKVVVNEWGMIHPWSYFVCHKPNKVDTVKTSMVATSEELEQQEYQDDLNEISKEKDDSKPPIFADTFGSNGGNNSETTGPEAPLKEIVDNGIESEVVVGLPGKFQEGDMVDALSRVEQKSSRS